MASEHALSDRFRGDIPIGNYGTSNQGMMKTIYRRGLSNRYGSMMQAIAGIHYNFSFSDSFCKFLQTTIPLI